MSPIDFLKVHTILTSKGNLFILHVFGVNGSKYSIQSRCSRQQKINTISQMSFVQVKAGEQYHI
jgi:hypothetical protein